MSTITRIKRDEYQQSKIHPLKLLLWISIASMFMMFAALTSAYIVRKAGGNWLEFEMPDVFLYSTILLITSSLTLHGSYMAFTSGKESVYKWLIVVTMLMGFAFLAMQYSGWEALTAIGVEINGNPSGSFVYAFTMVHGAHLIGGLASLGLAALHAFILQFRMTKKRKLRFQLTLTFWHFLGLLWIYLYLFLTWN